MGWATARTVSLTGLAGHLIDVQVDVSAGVVGTTLVGRPDASVTEARDRCRSAVTNSGFEWPTTRRVTVLLSPADLPKRGSHLDVAIALAVLAAAEEGRRARERRHGLTPDLLDGTVFLGELTLDGRLLAVTGALPMVLAARRHGLRRVVLPEIHVPEVSAVPGVEIVGARSLAQVVARLTGREVPDAPSVAASPVVRVMAWRGQGRTDELDLADVHGALDARYALEVAAAGGHHVLLSGPKGAGKTTLAERIPSLLPDLGVEEGLELAAVTSLAGDPGSPEGLPVRPPFRAPHHAASKASLLGGGTGRVHPGEISKALHGVLFLDEFPLFASDIIEALRQPLEAGEVTIARGAEVASFPARTMVVLAANPCPCGDYDPDARDDRCTCPEVRRRQYRSRISSPVVDRIDITRHVRPTPPHEVRDRLAVPETSAVVRARVTAARGRQERRLDGTPWRLNADVPGPELTRRWPLEQDAQLLVEDQLVSGALTRRGATRVHRLAWTVADLRDAAGRPGLGDVEVALLLRSGDPLPLATIDRRAG